MRTPCPYTSLTEAGLYITNTDGRRVKQNRPYAHTMETRFLCCVADVSAAASRKNISKQGWEGLSVRGENPYSISSWRYRATHMGVLIREIRHYFPRLEPMGGDPMFLQLENVTLDLSPNTTRQRSHGDYITN